MLPAGKYVDEKICLLCNGLAVVQHSQHIDGLTVKCDRCGYFRIEYAAIDQIEAVRHLISGLTRRASMPEPSVTTRITLTPNNIPELLVSSGIPDNLLDQLDITLQYAKDYQHRFDDFIEYEEYVATDYPLAFARDPKEFFHFFQALSEQGLLDEPAGRDPKRRTAFRITPNGWQRLRELDKTSRESSRAFVAMSFAPELEPAWIDGIRQALEALNFIPIRIDKTDADDKIDDRIIAEIRRSGLMVADFTGHRGGVYFEAGFALGLGIPIVWTCQREAYDQTHFDTRQYQHILWDTPEDLREQLITHIAARIPGRSLP